MAEQVENVQAEEKENVVLAGTRKIFWAGLGAAAVTQEEVSKVAKRLIERGEKVEADGRKRIEKMQKERRKEAEKAGKQAEKEFNKRMDSVWHRVNVPTTSDFDALNNKLNRLNKKIDELNKEIAQ